MKGTILLDYSENTLQVEEEEKSQFLKGILEQCFENIPDTLSQIQDIWGDTKGVLSPVQKIKLRAFISKYNIQSIDDLDGNLKIYLEREIIGEWHKPTYKLKQDLHALDPRKRIFLEMTVNYWSLFESSDNQQTEGEELDK